MTTALYRFLTLGMAVIYLALSARFIALGAPAWWFALGAPIAYTALTLFPVTLWFILSRAWGVAVPKAGRVGPAGYARMFVDEWTTIATSWPIMAFHELLIRDSVGSTADVPIVLIHGVWNNDGVWLRFLRWFAHRGVGPVYTFNCHPTVGDIESFAKQLADRVEAICAATRASQVVLIGHSMGGLIARAYLRRNGGKRISKIITIGTPNHGSRFAAAGVGRCLEQMRLGNEWLAELNQDSRNDERVPIVTIWSWHDTLVVPQTSSRLSGTKDIALVGVGHNALLRNRDVFLRLLEELDERGTAWQTEPLGSTKLDSR